MIWRPYVTSWSKRSLSRCGLLHHILCEWRLVKHYYFEWLWMGHYFGWVGVGGEIFWVGGWGWVGVSGGEWGCVHCLIMPKFFLWLVLQGLCLRWIVWWLSMAKMMNLMQIMQVVNGLVDSASEIQYGLLNLIFWYEFVDLLVGPSICTKFSRIYNHQFK